MGCNLHMTSDHIMLYCCFCIFTSPYVMFYQLISFYIFIMSRSNYTKRTFRKETKKHQIQLVQKFPHKSILKGSPFFRLGEAGGTRRSCNVWAPVAVSHEPPVGSANDLQGSLGVPLLVVEF